MQPLTSSASHCQVPDWGHETRAFKRKWSSEEEAILRQHEPEDISFEKIAELLPGRTATACRNRFSLFMDKVRTDPWTQGEIEMVNELAKTCLRGDGSRDYVKIGKALERSPLECRLKSNLNLSKTPRPTVSHPKTVDESWSVISHSSDEYELKSKKGKKAKLKPHWTTEQDEKLKKYVNEGMSFPEISKLMKGRTGSACSHRYKCISSDSYNPQEVKKVKSKRKYRKWSETDDQKLVQLFHKNVSYKEIGLQMGGRDRKGCSRRLKTLFEQNPSLRKKSEEEDFEIEEIPDTPVQKVISEVKELMSTDQMLSLFDEEGF